MQKLSRTLLMMAALLLKPLQQSVVVGHNPRSKEYESNRENESYLADILEHLARETKGNNEDCPEGFAYVASLKRCYSMLSDVRQTRENASIECRRRHKEAHLPVIQNEQQHKTIVEIILQSDLGASCPVGLWTSGRRSHPFRSFSWQPAASDETTQPSMDLTYTNWAKQRPWFAYGLNRNCLYLDRSKAWQWNQRSCETTLCVMCQIDL